MHIAILPTSSNALSTGANRLLFPRRFLIASVALAFASLIPGTAQAVDPPPDGGYPNNNTAEGEQSMTTDTSTDLNPVDPDGTEDGTGTQTDGFILPPLGLPPIPQMGRTVSLPEELWSYTLQGGKIARIMVHRVPGGGIQGLLHQLGIDVPIIQ